MSLILIDQQTAELLFNDEYTINENGEYYIDLNLIDNDGDGITETISGENETERDALFSGKFFSFNGARVSGNILSLPFDGGIKVSFHIKNNIQFYITRFSNGMRGGSDVLPLLDQNEFESYIGYDFNYFDLKIEALERDQKTDPISLKEEYLRLDDDGFSIYDYDHKNCYLSFKYHLQYKMETTEYYENLLVGLSSGAKRTTFRATDKFRLGRSGPITQISLIHEESPEREQFLISEVLEFYELNAQNELLNYLLTEYGITYSPSQIETVISPEITDTITFENREINVPFIVDEENNFYGKYYLVNNDLAQSFISANNGMPSFLRYDGIRYAILFQSLQSGWFTHTRLNNDSLELMHDLSSYQYSGQNINIVNYGSINDFNINVPTINLNENLVVIHKENQFYWTHELDSSNNIISLKIVTLTEIENTNIETPLPVTINYNQAYYYGNCFRVIKQINQFGFTDVTFETGENDLTYYKKIVSPLTSSSRNHTLPADYNDAYFSIYKNRQILGLESNESYVVDDYGTRVLDIIKIEDSWFSLEKLFLQYTLSGESFYVSRIDSTKTYPISPENEFVVIQQINPEDINLNLSITNNENIFNELTGHKVKPSKLINNSGSGVTEWDGVVPPPISGSNYVPAGDWSGNDYSGPTGPITSDTTNNNQNNQQTSNTEIPGVLFRLHAGNRHKFFPYSINNNEQPWTHSGEKVNIVATPKTKAWYVCWNIGIRSDNGTQLKMVNTRNPKESEEPILSFPKPKSLASVNDVTPYYVEQLENQQKWFVYLPGYSLPMFTVEPMQNCNLSYMTNSGWFDSDSTTSNGVSNSGLILTRLSDVITANDIELYVGCTAKNEDGSGLEIVYTRITLKANSFNSPNIFISWLPA